MAELLTAHQHPSHDDSQLIPVYCADERYTTSDSTAIKEFAYKRAEILFTVDALRKIDRGTLVVSEGDIDFNNIVFDVTHGHGGLAAILCWKGFESPVRNPFYSTGYSSLPENEGSYGVSIPDNIITQRLIDLTAERTLRYQDPQHCRIRALACRQIFGREEDRTLVEFPDLEAAAEGDLTKNTEELTEKFNEAFQTVFMYRTD